MSPTRPLTASQGRARTLLLAGLAGTHVGAALCVTAFGVTRGALSAASAALGAALVVFFFTLGGAVQLAVADARPRLVLVASLGSYLVRVGILVLLLAVYDRAWRWRALDGLAVAVTVIVTVICWLGSEIVAYSRLRIPVLDTRYTR